jgi:hypothetical protein
MSRSSERARLRWNLRAIRVDSRGRNLGTIRVLGWGLLGVMASTVSLLLLVFTLTVVFIDRWVEQWADAIEDPRLPDPESFASWRRDGSPMDCLLTSKRATLSVWFGHHSYCMSHSTEGSLTLRVTENQTAVSGDFGGESRAPDETFAAQDLPGELGRAYLRDFIGATQRPESPASCRDFWGGRDFMFARLTFTCDGTGPEPIYFQAICPRWEGRRVDWIFNATEKYRYYRADGVIDVAMGIGRRHRNSLRDLP